MSDSEQADDDSPIGLGRMILKLWYARKEKLEHDYSITGWALSIVPYVRADVEVRMKGTHRDAIERVVKNKKLHLQPCPNPDKEVATWSEAQLLDVFWREYGAFSKKQEPFHHNARWNSPFITQGQSWLWHEQYSLPYTRVLGFVACRVTSKVLGIGAAERSWGALKDIKSGHRAHMGEESVEMRTILYTTARINDARNMQAARERLDAPSEDALFGDDDIK